MMRMCCQRCAAAVAAVLFGDFFGPSRPASSSTPCRRSTAGNRPSISSRSGSLYLAISLVGEEARPAPSSVTASCPARGMTQAHMRSPMSGSGIGDAGDVLHRGMRQDQILDFLGADLLAAAVDQVLLAALDHVVAGRVLAHQIARAIEAVRGEGLRVVLGRAVIAAQRVGSARAELADLAEAARSLSSSSSSRTSSSGEIGKPTVSSRTSSGSSSCANISMPSDMPKFSCTKALGISSLVANAHFGLQALAAALDVAHGRRVVLGHGRAVDQPDQQRRHHLDVRDAMLLDQSETSLRAASSGSSTILPPLNMKP